MSDTRQLAGLIVVRVYGALVCLAGLLLVFVAGVLTQTHAAGAAIYLLLLGAVLAALAPFIWIARRWAMLAAVAVSAIGAAHYVAQDPGDWWLAVPLPALFSVLTAGAIVAGVKAAPFGPWRDGAALIRLYSAAVYVCGVAIVFLTPLNYAGRMLVLGPPGATAYALVLGIAFAGLSIAIWRGQRWAMVAAFAIALVHWLALASLDASFLTDWTYWSVSLVFGLFTAVGLASSRAHRSS